MIGDEVTPVRSLLELKYPIKEGIIEDKEELELLWRYAISDKIKIPGENLRDHFCMVTEAPLNPVKNKEFMIETLLEKLNFGACNIETQAKLALIYEGRDTGLVVDSGDGVTHCIPIVSNHIDHHNIMRLNIAGRHITEYLVKLLQRKGYAFNSTADFETVREIKEKFCFTSCNIKGDRKLERETTYYNSYYKLPSGKTIKISDEKFEAPEILFNPMLFNVESLGVHDMVTKCIQSCAMDNRRMLYNAIFLSGANTLFPGFSSRIEDEIKNSYRRVVLGNPDQPIKIPINIVDSPNRQYSVFNGAVFLSNFYKNILNYWISKEDWDDCGPQIIYKKCPNIMI